MTQHSLRVVIAGTGYVGLTTGVALAWLGHRVTCVDTDERKIAALRAGEVPIYEPGLPELLAAARERLAFTTSYADAVPGADVVFIAVGTPPKPDGSPDLRYLKSASDSIGHTLAGEFTVIVNKSTVPIGSGNWVEALIRTAYETDHGVQADGRFAVASNPEFLREGCALADTLYADRIVIGADSPRALDVLCGLYQPILEQTFTPPAFLPRPAGHDAVPLVRCDLASAEMIKYAANAFLALKISFINEVGNLAERVGASVREVARGIGLDSRIGSRFLQAGIGWGGSCFGKDTAALAATAAEYGLALPIVAAAREINQRQRVRVVEKLLGELKILKGRTIALLGLAFKPDTDDLRDAPSVDIAQRLLDHGALVRVHDPVAAARFRQEYPDLDVACAESVEAACAGADAIVLVTEWAAYAGLDWDALRSKVRTPLVVDGRSFFIPGDIAAAGFRYVTIP